MPFRSGTAAPRRRRRRGAMKCGASHITGLSLRSASPTSPSTRIRRLQPRRATRTRAGRARGGCGRASGSARGRGARARRRRARGSRARGCARRPCGASRRGASRAGRRRCRARPATPSGSQWNSHSAASSRRALKLPSFAFADIPPPAPRHGSAPEYPVPAPSRSGARRRPRPGRERRSSYNRRVAELLNNLRGDLKEFR